MLTVKNLNLYLLKDMRTLIEDLSFSVQPGERLALIGEEGNGKSTILKAIAQPHILKDYVKMTGEISTAGEMIAYLPQLRDPVLMEKTTEDYFNQMVDWHHFDYGEFYRLLSSMNFPEERISSSYRVGELSGGEKIKFLLLCEMMKNPSLLLLDEPSNDLDLESITWLEEFILGLKIPLVFVSHDETLLERCATSLLHIEQIQRKSSPRITKSGLGYRDYVKQREEEIERQRKQSKKDKDEFDKKIQRYQKVYERVQHELRSVSRGEPQAARNLKDKMHSVKSMGRRFEKEKETLRVKPDVEESVLVRFSSEVEIASRREVLDMKLDVLMRGERILSKNIHLALHGPEKICIVGKNGSGKTTLLKEIKKELEDNKIPHGYMPQTYSEVMKGKESAVDFLTRVGDKEEHTLIRTYLGSVKFTEEEMFHPVDELSGGQRAKLYFTKMILDQAQVLLLDEPTRNLSPLSSPEVRQALKSFPGCIIAVSHDRKLIEEVFDQVYLLDEEGLHLRRKEDLF